MVGAAVQLPTKFPPDTTSYGGWFLLMRRKNFGRVIATLPEKREKRRLRRLLKVLLQLKEQGVSVISIELFYGDSRPLRFRWTGRDLRDFLRFLREVLRERVSLLSSQKSFWEEVRLWASPSSQNPSPGYGREEFNQIYNSFLLRLRRIESFLSRLERWERKIKEDILLRENLISSLRYGEGGRRWREIDALENECAELRRELRRIRRGREFLLKRYGQYLEGTKEGTKVRWDRYVAHRRKWFVKLTSPPSQGGVDLPPSKLRGEGEVSASSLRLTSSLWEEEYQDLNGFRIHYMNELFQA